MRGRDLKYRLEVDFLDAVRGVKKRVTMPDGRVLDIAIPAGVESGQTLRLKGQGEPGVSGGPTGDVYVEISVKPHALFEREGDDIHIEADLAQGSRSRRQDHRADDRRRGRDQRAEKFKLGRRSAP